MSPCWRNIFRRRYQSAGHSVWRDAVCGRTAATSRRECEQLAGLLLALLAYALLRSTFLFFFNSKECFLFSSSATLAHMLLLTIPFSASRFPLKGTLRLLFAILFINNGAFIIGRAVTCCVLERTKPVPQRYDPADFLPRDPNLTWVVPLW